jgi:SAM-dependent methyltransferase
LTLTSKFLSKRAWDGPIELSRTNKCSYCGFAFHARGLSESEVSNYYSNYRDEKYFVDRNSCEPFYTRRAHDELESHLGGKLRREALIRYLGQTIEAVSQSIDDFSVLDFAGGKGRLVQDFAGKKYVYDVSGELAVDGVTSLSEADLIDMSFDLVVCAQMLEHATDPLETLKRLLGLVRPGGHLYIEVPYNETWKDFSFDGKIRTLLLKLAMRSSWFNILLDSYGTVFRVKFKILPPLAFVPVREHLNYFTPQSFIELGNKIGGQVVDASRQELLGTVLLLRK